MLALRQRLRGYWVESLLGALAATIATLAIAVFAERRLGAAGLFVPLLLVAAALLVRRPIAAVSLAVAMPILCEGPTFGIPVMTKLYNPVFKQLTALDLLVAFAVVAVGLDLIRRRRQPHVPAALGFSLLLVALAMAAGLVVTQSGGAGLRDTLFSMHVLGYLLVLPVAIVNVDLDEDQLKLLLKGALALALLKAAMGLIVMATGGSVELDGGTHLTYYEPTANWLILLAMLGTIAALVGGMPRERWMVVGVPLLITAIVLSYRRSFWIAAVLGLLLVLLLGTSRRSRRVLVPAVALVAIAIWVVGSIQFQAQTPLAHRVQSLAPSKLETNAEDRYRLDERVNVIAQIERQPIAGIGLRQGWRASERPLPVEHVDGRLYVHFSLLWWWMKLGILGAIAFVSVLLSGLLLSWRTWRNNSEPLFRCFGLASMCGILGLVAIETTASFTGVDARFTVVFATQLGLLAVLQRGVTSPAGGSLATAGGRNT
ncbi:MAG TPA: O-antigen ligase family protein [Conexibacter sp.]|nr:O-antigen ligase family protein [Conexibacter sp.]